MKQSSTWTMHLQFRRLFTLQACSHAPYYTFLLKWSSNTTHSTNAAWWKVDGYIIVIIMTVRLDRKGETCLVWNYKNNWLVYYIFSVLILFCIPEMGEIEILTYFFNHQLQFSFQNSLALKIQDQMNCKLPQNFLSTMTKLSQRMYILKFCQLTTNRRCDAK